MKEQSIFQLSNNDTVFIIFHPRLALQTARRRFEVGMDIAYPPQGTTIEEYPELPFVAAMRLMARQDSKQ